MFSGIVETTTRVLGFNSEDEVCQLILEKPSQFEDLCSGHSIAVDGVCLTLEKISPGSISFSVGPETLNITRWNRECPMTVGSIVNLERSMKWGDRVHGHLVTGHVEGLGRILRETQQGECVEISLELPAPLVPFIMKKGSIALNGVSLTVNEIREKEVMICLVPETLRRTNLGNLWPGDLVNVETDYFIKAIFSRRSNELHP